MNKHNKQWLFYTPLVWGKTASFGGDIGGLGAQGCTSSGSRGRDPVQGIWGRSPQKLKAFCFTIFFWGTRSDQTLYMTDLDAWWLKMRGITQGCAFWGLKYLMCCCLLAGKRLLKLLKLNNSFIVSFL